MSIPPRPVNVIPGSSTSLCIRCGLCCDGTLFSRVPVELGDEAAAEAAGLVIDRERDTHFFRQPCAGFAGGRCAVYANRPTPCRNFRCKLLKSFQAGEIDLDTALEKVELAMQLRRKIAEDEPEAARHKDRRRIQRELLASKQRTQLLLNIISLEYFFDQWFRKKKKEAASETLEAELEAADKAGRKGSSC